MITYPEHIKKALEELADKGFAIAIFTPKELQGVSPDYVEDAIIKSGFDTIHYHKDPTEMLNLLKYVKGINSINYTS